MKKTFSAKQVDGKANRPSKFPRAALRLLTTTRVARLATVNADGTAHVVPIVFATDGRRIYSIIDNKPKAANRSLRRIRNITRTRAATLLADEYSEDWSKLRYVIVYCRAQVIRGSTVEGERARRLLRRKYVRQYVSEDYFPKDRGKALIIRLSPRRIVGWTASSSG